MIVNRLYLLLTGLLIIPITIYAQTDIEPDPDQPIGPVTNVGLEYKFDPGFYNKILDIMDDPVIEGDPGVFDGTRYYDTILVISRGGIDGDLTAKQNKESLLIKLNEIGARDIYVAEILSFITASIPIGEVPGISIHDEVYALGDGEQKFTTDISINAIRQFINAEEQTINDIQNNLNGSGITVSVIDTGINHVSLNDKVKKRIFCPDGNCINNTRLQSTTDIDIDILNDIPISHGTRVAQIIINTGLQKHNGLSPGVDLLDGFAGHADSMGNIMKGILFFKQLDWSHKNGVDVVNISLSSNFCGEDTNTHDLIINESIDKGMVIIKSAGNQGYFNNKNIYNSITNPGCGENIITVGGSYIRTQSPEMFKNSSRGPINDRHLLKPDLTTSAVLLDVFEDKMNNKTITISGTSFAAPQVTSAVALMLQLDPTLTPIEVKSLLLLSADWTGPVPCTSSQYEQNNPNDNCSFARQPSDFEISKKLDILNNVGHGILNIGQTLQYIKDGKHIIYDYLDSIIQTKNYTINIKDKNKPVKLVLTWLVHPHGSILEQKQRANNPDKYHIPIANLDFTVQCRDGTNHTINSVNQTVEFIIFQPTSKGKCTISVTGSGLDDINKPVQNFALSSTVPFKQPKDTSDDLIGINDTIYINNDLKSFPIYLTSSNNDNKSISYTITKQPTKGVITSPEFITITDSRVLYTIDDTFNGTDTFEFTPTSDYTGDPGTITIINENRPSHTDVQIRGDNIKDWKTLLPNKNTPIDYQLIEFTRPLYEVEAIHFGSVNVQGGLIRIVTVDDQTYNIVVTDTEMIKFDKPILIKTLQLSTEWLDEEAVSIDDSDFRIFVGLVPVNKNIPTSYEMIGDQVNINDIVKSKPFKINEDGRITSGKIYINITDINTSDLKITLKTPSDGDIYLFNRLDRGNTYQYESTSEFDNMVGKNLKGEWALKLHNFAGHNNGKITGWKLQLGYMPNDPIAQPVIDGTVIFKEDFEGTLDKWSNSQNSRWRIQSPDMPIPWYNDTKVLKATFCRDTCTITLNDPIDLSMYSTASLSFMQLVDNSLDGNEYLKVELHKDNTWETIYHWSNNLGNINGKWKHEFYDLSNYLVDDFKIRFTTQQNSFFEDVNIDDIIITDAPVTRDISKSIYIVNTGFDSITVFTDNILLGNIIQLPRSSNLIDMTFDDNGNIYVSDSINNVIRKYNNLGIVLDNSWANTTNPSGIEWYNNTLYVATRNGIEMFDVNGNSMGYFGDAHRSESKKNKKFPMTTNGMTFCGDKVFASDPTRNTIYQYNLNGTYIDRINNKNTRGINDITCNNENNTLYQSSNRGHINVIDISDKSMSKITNQINKPHGLDFDKNGKLYVANTGANNILIIDGSTIILDKQINAPKGVQIGPKYQGFMGASNNDIIPNNTPVILISYNGTSDLPITTNTNNTILIDITVSDADNDPITISLDPDMIPQNNINLTDNNNGTGTVQINTNIPSGDYVFWIKAVDGIDTELLPVTLYVQ